MKNAQADGVRIKEIIANMFHLPAKTEASGTILYGIKEARVTPEIGISYGKGSVYLLNNVIDRQIWWNRQSSAFDPFLKVLRNRIAPDLGIDFAAEGLRRNEGIAFQHRQVGKSDFYFLCNIQDKISTLPLTFRTTGKKIRKWDPLTGKISDIQFLEETPKGVRLHLELGPYQSCFLEFAPDTPEHYVSATNFREIRLVKADKVVAATSSNGRFITTIKTYSGEKTVKTDVTGIPAPLVISGQWKLFLPGIAGQDYSLLTDMLTSWSENPVIKNFSGTGSYTIDFDLPENFLTGNQEVWIDPGKVGNIAEILVNGKPAGTCWMRGEQKEISRLIKKGSNHLELLVTNTLISRISGMSQPDPLPASMVERYGTKGRNSGNQREFGFSPLPASGLLGPVTLSAMRKVELQY